MTGHNCSPPFYACALLESCEALRGVWKHREGAELLLGVHHGAASPGLESHVDAEVASGAHLCVCFASKALMEALPSLNRIFLGEVRVVVQSFLFISSYVTPPRRLSALKIAANPCRFHFKVSILSLLVS